MKKLSICIPSYNRANKLEELLLSILSQDYKDYEILIVEDFSPERKQISEIVKKFQSIYKKIEIRYFENEYNLGYDKNCRRIIELAKGEYCFFMGNDDLINKDAFNSIEKILNSYSNIGVIVRSYATFKKSNDKLEEIFRYSKKELYLPPGPETIAYTFRRSVVASGMIYHTELSRKYETDLFDGTLLYQLYLVSKILQEKCVVFNPKITVLHRMDGIPDFGNSIKEKELFTPEKQTIISSLNFVKGMISIGKYAGRNNRKITKLIIKDISHYSYPIIAIQSRRKKIEFLRYIFSLIKIGIGNSLMFYIYAFGLLFLGKKIMDRLIKYLKNCLGYTPNFFN